MAEEEGILAKKEENFSEWFHEVIQKTGLIDQRFPLQGFLVFGWLGLEIHENYMQYLESLYKKNGYKKYYFPALIPERLLATEAEHIRGFHDQVFWVTHSGEKPMGERAALRPTSETAMYEMFKLWIRSYKDLPLKIFQTTSVFRSETKHTRPLIRDREILWNEAHSAHVSLEDINKHVKEVVEIYKKLFEYCAIPVIFFDVVSGIFAGALQAIEAYTIFPDGRVLEMGSVNNLGQRFSKAFNVTFLDENGERKYVYQGSYGVSERILAAIVALHGDNKGLILPPNVAPIQVIIIPILGKKDEKIINYCKKVKKMLENDLKVEMDLNKEKTPGWKFNYYEMLGVPLRIEIGEKELMEKTITIVRRDNRKRQTIKFEKAIEKIKSLLNVIQKKLYKKAKEELKKKLSEAKDISQLKKILEEKGGLVKTEWCGKKECADYIKAETKGGEIIGILYEKKEAPRGKCIWCNGKSKYVTYVGNSY
ncbi:MAG: proline--tRNA ligase [Candidatus Aenigmatarchaeota archaeon]